MGARNGLFMVKDLKFQSFASIIAKLGASPADIQSDIRIPCIGLGDAEAKPLMRRNKKT
jgi:hypothetical protein